MSAVMDLSRSLHSSEIDTLYTASLSDDGRLATTSDEEGGSRCSSECPSLAGDSVYTAETVTSEQMRQGWRDEESSYMMEIRAQYYAPWYESAAMNAVGAGSYGYGPYAPYNGSGVGLMHKQREKRRLRKRLLHSFTMWSILVMTVILFCFFVRRTLSGNNDDHPVAQRRPTEGLVPIERLDELPIGPIVVDVDNVDNDSELSAVMADSKSLGEEPAEATEEPHIIKQDSIQGLLSGALEKVYEIYSDFLN